MASRRAALAVVISGDTKQLERSLIRAGGGLDKFGKKAHDSNARIGSSFSGMAKRAVGAGAAAVGAYASIAGAKKAIDTTTTLAKTTLALHNNLGLSVAQASRWAAVAKARDIDSKALNQSFVTLSKNVVSAKAGTEASADAFKKLGISQKELKRLNFDQTLKAAADGFAKLPAGADRAKISAQLFGRGWQTVVPILRDGSKALREQLALADKYGVTFKGKTVKSLEDLIKAQRESKFATMGLQVAFGTQLAPALTKAITASSKFVAQMRTGKGAGGQFAKVLKDIWEEAKPIVSFLGRAATAVGRFTAKHPEVGKLAAAIIGVGVAVKTLKFVSSATGFTDLLKAGRSAASGLKRILGRGGAAAGESAAANAAGSMVAGTGGRNRGRVTGAFNSLGRAAGRTFVTGFLIALPALLGEIEKKVAGLFGDIPDKIGEHLGLGDLADALGNPGGIGRASGGIIPGSGNKDTVPAMLTPGEFVIRKQVVEKYGPTFFANLNGGMGAPQGQSQVRGYTSGGIIARANALDRQARPYKWGGGHGDGGRNGWDCSGAVSYALGVPPRVSGGFTSWGSPGLGRPNDTKVYANASHVFAVFNGRGWGTSGENPGGGPGWISYNSRPGFVIRHISDAEGGSSGSGTSGSGTTGNAQEPNESGGSTRGEREERRGSRIVNRAAAPFSRAIRAATRTAASLGTAIESGSTSFGQTERRQAQTDEDLGTPAGRSARTDELAELKEAQACAACPAGGPQGGSTDSHSEVRSPYRTPAGTAEGSQPTQGQRCRKSARAHQGL